MDKFEVGDLVICRWPNHWCDAKRGFIHSLDITDALNIHGHYVQIDGGLVVVREEHLQKVGARRPTH